MIGDVTETFADAVVPLPSVATAVTEQMPALNGAEKSPLVALMLPQVAVHVAGAPALNCCVWFSTRLG